MNLRKDKIRVAVTDHDFPPDSFEIEKGMLEECGVDLSVLNCKSIDELYEKASDFDVFINQYLPFKKEDMERFKNLKLIVKYTYGYDNIDVKGASELGILVCRNYYGKEEVADHTMALILSAIRKIPQADRMVREGKWKMGEDYRKHIAPIPCIQDMVLGIIGCGAIGRQVIRKSREFFEDILCYDPYTASETINQAGGRKVDDLDILLQNSDVITLHALLTDETYHLINEERINRMKDNAVIVNAGRGALIDTDALVKALKRGKISSAALDTTEIEPIPPDSPLLKMDNVIITPHIGGYSEFTIYDCRRKAAEKIVQFIHGRLPDFCVNPEVFKTTC
jgi:D-3-phosphoglycerate dehydrogenase